MCVSTACVCISSQTQHHLHFLTPPGLQHAEPLVSPAHYFIPYMLHRENGHRQAVMLRSARGISTALYRTEIRIPKGAGPAGVFPGAAVPCHCQVPWDFCFLSVVLYVRVPGGRQDVLPGTVPSSPPGASTVSLSTFPSGYLPTDPRPRVPQRHSIYIPYRTPNIPQGMIRQAASSLAKPRAQIPLAEQ